jgi:DNA-binding Lrp family transcriptional regulator
VKELLEERIDEADYRIFKALNQDGRMSDTDLAERVDLSRTAARRRRKKLQDSGILDIPALLVFQESGFSYADIHVKYDSSANEDDITALINDLLDESLVYEMAECIGEYDLLLRVWHASLGDIKSYVRDQLNSQEIVDSYTIVPITQSYKMWFRDFSSGND